jgi:hypothetical protein
MLNLIASASYVCGMAYLIAQYNYHLGLAFLVYTAYNYYTQVQYSRAMSQALKNQRLGDE